MGIFSVIGSVLCKVGGVVGYATGAIGLVEQLAKILKGTKRELFSNDKHDLVVVMIKESITQTEMFLGKEIIDEEMFAEGLDQVIHGIIKMANASGLKGK